MFSGHSKFSFALHKSIKSENQLKTNEFAPTNPDPLPDDFWREHEIFKDGVVDRRESTTSWSHLFLVARLPCRLREDTALSHNENVFTREFLLQLPHQSYLEVNKQDFLQVFQGSKRNGKEGYFNECWPMVSSKVSSPPFITVVPPFRWVPPFFGFQIRSPLYRSHAKQFIWNRNTEEGKNIMELKFFRLQYFNIFSYWCPKQYF